MKYKVTIITTREEIIDADNDYDCDAKAARMAQNLSANDYDFRQLDREELQEIKNELHPVIKAVFDPYLHNKVNIGGL